MSYGIRRTFYKSKAWNIVRLNIWREQHCLCYLCKKPVYVKGLSDDIPKEKRRRGIVHHIEHLTEENVFNPEITLDEKNLVGVCKDCHEKKCHNQVKSTRETIMFDEDGNPIKRNIPSEEEIKLKLLKLKEGEGNGKDI